MRLCQVDQILRGETGQVHVGLPFGADIQPICDFAIYTVHYLFEVPEIARLGLVYRPPCKRLDKFAIVGVQSFPRRRRQRSLRRSAFWVPRLPRSEAELVQLRSPGLRLMVLWRTADCPASLSRILPPSLAVRTYPPQPLYAVRLLGDKGIGRIVAMSRATENATYRRSAIQNVKKRKVYKRQRFDVCDRVLSIVLTLTSPVKAFRFVSSSAFSSRYFTLAIVSLPTPAISATFSTVLPCSEFGTGLPPFIRASALAAIIGSSFNASSSYWPESTSAAASASPPGCRDRDRDRAKPTAPAWPKPNLGSNSAVIRQ